MKRLTQFAWVILLIVSVVTIFVSPAVDLQPTALRAMKGATLLLAGLVLAGFVLCARLSVLVALTAIFVERHSVPSPTPDLLNLNCALLC